VAFDFHGGFVEHKMGEKWNWNLLRRNLSCSDWRYMWGSHELLAASCRDLVGYQVEYTAGRWLARANIPKMVQHFWLVNYGELAFIFADESSI